MKKFILFLILILPFNIFAQEVKNVKFKQDRDKIIITYDLTAKKRMCIDITAFYTIDKGKTFIPLKSTTGDVGKDINKGKNKKIIWNVLNDNDGIINNIQFKIVADYYKPKIEDYLILNGDLIIVKRFGGGLNISYGRFKSPTKKTGILISGNVDSYSCYDYSDYDYHYGNPYDFGYDCSYDNINIGVNFGLMHKLVNKPKFKLICYQQIGLNICGFDYHYYDDDYYYHTHENGFYNYFTFPFPISTGLIFNIHRFNILTGIKIHNNNKSIKKVKELNLVLIPPAYTVGISFGIGYTF